MLFRELFVILCCCLASDLLTLLPFSGLGPGAQLLVKKITDSSLPNSERMKSAKTPVREMTVQDWSVLLKAFDEWPFAPEVCFAPARFSVEEYSV